MEKEKWLHSFLTEGGVGLEEENQRVTADGYLSDRKHPFSDERFDRDFCESQLEMITGVSHNVSDAVAEVGTMRRQAAKKIDSNREYLWPFSNPPYIRSDDDIPIAQFTGERAEKTIYRDHLAKVYGKKLQTLCGIHFNYSFPKGLVENESDVYLKLAEQLVRYSWLIVALTAASPAMDASWTDYAKIGQTVYGEYSSVRCSEKGYWNSFLPVLSFGSIDAYIDSVESYVKSGALYSFSELYYPIRLKPAGVNTLENLRNGINHIELRMLDVNPLYAEGINRDDLTFIVTFIAYLTDQIIHGNVKPLLAAEQQEAIDNMKSAAHYPLEKINIFHEGKIYPLTEIAISIIEDVEKWATDEVEGAIIFEKEKILHPENRYASIVIDRFGNDFVREGLKAVKGE